MLRSRVFNSMYMLYILQKGFLTVNEVSFRCVPCLSTRGCRYSLLHLTCWPLVSHPPTAASRWRRARSLKMEQDSRRARREQVYAQRGAFSDGTERVREPVALWLPKGLNAFSGELSLAPDKQKWVSIQTRWTWRQFRLARISKVFLKPGRTLIQRKK